MDNGWHTHRIREPRRPSRKQSLRKATLTVLKGDTGRITCSRKALDHRYPVRHGD